jgi:hypothetical protein
LRVVVAISYPLIKIGLERQQAEAACTSTHFSPKMS